MGVFKSRSSKWTLIVAAALAVAATHSLWLGALGSFLVRSEAPYRAGVVVVLGGDGYGNRILKAADLVRQGFAPEVLVSGPPGYYGHYECDLAIHFAVSRGYPESWFIPLPIAGYSTREEAVSVLAELRRRQVKRFLLVTSDYHTRRAAAIYRSLVRGEEFRVVAARDEFFRADSWWKSRQGRKVFLFEWMKTLGEWLGL